MTVALARYNPLAIIGRMFQAVFPESKARNEVAPLDRRSVYAHLWNYYMNQVYTRELYGGSLDYINQSLGEAAAKDLAGLIMPVEQAVELYAQNTFYGQFGEDIIVDEVTGNKNNERPVNKAIIAPLDKIDDWSNMNAEKDRLARLAALFGSVGIRVVAKVGRNYPNDEVADRRVYLQFEHPALINDYKDDTRANLEQIVTEHRVLEGDLQLRDGDPEREVHVYKMFMSKTKFETLRDGEPYNNITDDQQQQFASYENIYGFVPYVIAHFRKHDGQWGAWCFAGSEALIDRINALCSHINRQIFRHVNVTWVVTSSGEPPEEYNLSGNRLLYIRRQMQELGGDTTIEPLIANLSIADAITQLKFLNTILADRMPELKATSGEFISGQSGETIAQLRLPAEDRVRVFRANLESALIRARKMALSIGIVLGLWDVGTGIGTVEAANQAFQEGLLDHRFNKRRVLSITASEELTNKKLEADLEATQNESNFLSEAVPPNTVSKRVSPPSNQKQLPPASDE